VLLQTVMAWGPWGDRNIARLHRLYGDMFTVTILPTGPMVIVADPELVREVFRGSPAKFHAGEGNEVLRPVLGDRSVLVADEDEHLRRRRLMLPMFHGEAVSAYAEIIRDVAAEEVASWPAGQRFALLPRMRALTFEVIARAVFGVRGDAELARFRKVIPPVLDIGMVEMQMWQWPSLGRLWPWRRYVAVQERADAVLRDEMARRRREPGLDARDDILSLLLRARYDDGTPLDDDDARDQLVTLLLAGHETTGTALAWAFERLLAYPDVMARAAEAAHSGDDTYLDAVVSETLRSRPVVHLVARTLTSDAELGGYLLPAGVTVAPAIGLIHHSPSVYPEPERFRPERWLVGETPPSYGWIPFGGGVRRCLGAAFAQLEMRLVLGEVLRRVTLRRASRLPDRANTRNIFNSPSRGVPVRVVARV
jgi:cytochrome P450